MKTATLPSLRVEPEFREELESMLAEGETVSAFIENSVRQALRKRQLDAEFQERGMKALAQWRKDGIATPAEEVLARMERKLEAARAEQARRRSSK